MLLKLQASIDGTPILESAVEGADASGILAADNMIARSGVTRGDARAWAMDALETRRYADDARATERLLSTLLWLACSGTPAPSRSSKRCTRAACLHAGSGAMRGSRGHWPASGLRC